jgi:hypothetical protein
MQMLQLCVLPCIGFALLMTVIIGCEKNRGDAVVLTKEHIDAAPTELTPDAKPESSREVQIRPMTDDEIAVDGLVMKPEVRGTSRDPRALKDEQWLVKVRTIADGRTFKVATDQAKWEKLRENDRVKVRYRTGKYTGTVWEAEIE